MDRRTKLKAVAQLYNQIHGTHVQYFHLWKHETLLHWDWWASLLLAIAPWFIWSKLRKRDSTFRLFFVGLFVITLTSWLDFIGIISGAWYYSGKLIPTIPSYIPFDFCLFPVIVMLMIQYKPMVSAWVKAFIFGAFSAFVAEPVFAWMKLYTLVHWKYMYSFPIYILIYLAADWMSRRNSFSSITEHQ